MSTASALPEFAIYEQALTLAQRLGPSYQTRLVAQLTGQPVPPVPLEDALERALSLGQDPAIVQQVREGKMHRVMLSYGLLKDDEAFATLMEEIMEHRQRQSDRPEVEF